MYYAHPIDFFCLTNVEKKKKKQIYQVWFLFGMSPGVDSYSCTILEQSINNKMVSKI